MWFSAVDTITQPEVIDAVFDAAASEHLPAVVVFPTIRGEEELLAQLAILGRSDRWTIARETVKNLTTTDLLVGIRWTTSAGLVSTPMGFAPLATMPVTRRAPYVCLATWPGNQENPHHHRRRPRPGYVDFLDAAIAGSFSTIEFDKLWDASTTRTHDLLAETGDDARLYRTVTYRLSRAAAASDLAPH
jgi:hypothetical protein